MPPTTLQKLAAGLHQGSSTKPCPHAQLCCCSPVKRPPSTCCMAACSTPGAAAACCGRPPPISCLGACNTMLHCLLWWHAGPYRGGSLFWAPTVKWGISIANIADFSKPTEQISYPQQLAVLATGLIWSRFATQIIPVRTLPTWASTALQVQSLLTALTGNGLAKECVLKGSCSSLRESASQGSRLMHDCIIVELLFQCAAICACWTAVSCAGHTCCPACSGSSPHIRCMRSGCLQVNYNLLAVNATMACTGMYQIQRKVANEGLPGSSHEAKAAVQA